MKYIKKFENIQFKKFMILTNNSDNFFDDYNKKYKFYIVRYIGPDSYVKGDFEVKFIFKYNDEKNFEKINKNGRYRLKSNMSILYQSSTLKDCMKMLPILKDSNNYNL